MQNQENSKEQKNKRKINFSIPLSLIAAGFIIALAIVYIGNPKQANLNEAVNDNNTKDDKENIIVPDPTNPNIEAFGSFQLYPDNEVCIEDGKPIIRLFSTTWCPHCKWIKETYEEVVKEYQQAGKIIAYHWEIDENNNTLTNEDEKEFPAKERAIYEKFNPKGSIPTFIFGCKYGRIGNGYESQDDLDAEEAEFRTIIQELIKSLE